MRTRLLHRTCTIFRLRLGSRLNPALSTYNAIIQQWLRFCHIAGKLIFMDRRTPQGTCKTPSQAIHLDLPPNFQCPLSRQTWWRYSLARLRPRMFHRYPSPRCTNLAQLPCCQQAGAASHSREAHASDVCQCVASTQRA